MGIALPAANAGSSPSPAPTEAATSIFALKGFAEGPAKPTPSAAPVEPKTVLDPYAVADPYGDYVSPAPPVDTPSTPDTSSPGTGG